MSYLVYHVSESNVYGIYKTEGRYGEAEEMLVCADISLREDCFFLNGCCPWVSNGTEASGSPVYLHSDGGGERQSICLNGGTFLFLFLFLH